MKFEEYPIIKVYIAEIDKLYRRKRHLPLIFLIGATAELMLREITDDLKTGMRKLIVKAEKTRAISHKRGLLFGEIRMYRNKYTHISANRILNGEISGLFFWDENGLMQNVNEIVFNDLSERTLRRTLQLHIAGNSEISYHTFGKLLRSLRNR